MPAQHQRSHSNLHQVIVCNSNENLAGEPLRRRSGIHSAEMEAIGQDTPTGRWRKAASGQG